MYININPQNTNLDIHTFNTILNTLLFYEKIINISLAIHEMNRSKHYTTYLQRKMKMKSPSVTPRNLYT